jgi:hypothetical protein
MSTSQIRSWLRTHQRRLKAGDDLPFMTEVARRAGIHRDTVYSLMSGERISERSQYALSRVIREIEAETSGNTKTRLMSISLGQGVPRLHIGLQAAPILSKR